MTRIENLTYIPESEACRFPASVFGLQGFIDREFSIEQLDRFKTIYNVRYGERPMRFASLEAAEHVARRMGYAEGRIPDAQRSLSIADIVTKEQTLFNPDRANRPFPPGNTTTIESIEAANPPENCDFQEPGRKTPIEPFVNIDDGAFAVFPNAASYVPHHSMVVSREIHHPREITEEGFVRKVELANLWMKEEVKYNPRAQFPFFGLNLYTRSGSSIHHPHLQFGLTERPFEPTEDVRRHTADYKWLQKGVSYFEQKIKLYRDLGLSIDAGDTEVLASLTPVKEKGIELIQKNSYGLPTRDFAKALYSVIDWMRTEAGAHSINAYIWAPPLGIDTSETGDWHKFPVFARIVDRGDLSRNVSDVGFMEMMAKVPVVASDPYRVAELYRDYKNRKVQP